MEVNGDNWFWIQDAVVNQFEINAIYSQICYWQIKVKLLLYGTWSHSSEQSVLCSPFQVWNSMAKSYPNLESNE